tara:strand:+ start:1099 stop:2409 length:1311 start_codon:yes stop_codon:yes gene_type:complete
MVEDIDNLDTWRRTAYSNEITKENSGEEVIVFGWVASYRDQGNLIFIIINDKYGSIQITVKKNEIKDEIYQKVNNIKEQASIGVKGVVKLAKKAPNEVEIVPIDLKILSKSEKTLPFNIFAKTLPSIDKRLDIRAFDLRRTRAQNIFNVREIIIKAIREYYNNTGYREINTPKIISSATEGGAALFPILYYNREAFLTQSPQLYKEQLIVAFEKVFEIGSAFRAEQSRTLSHLSEFISVDVEEAYVNYTDIMNTIEKMINNIITRLNESDILEKFQIEKKQIKKFKTYTYKEILNLLNKKGVEKEWGEDITSKDLKDFNEEEFYFIIDWPTASKPFYIKPNKDDPEISESFDLMFGNKELASGGTRISSKKLLLERFKEKKLKTKAFESHIKMFDYGVPPHAGVGLGLERLIMSIIKEENVREVTFFPRDQRRLTP